jgi:hypothetical protein
VRYDGTYLYVATYRGLAEDRGEIRILRTEPASASATQVSSIPLPESTLGVMGMYVTDGRLFLVTAEPFFGGYDGIGGAGHRRLGAHETHGPGV